MDIFHSLNTAQKEAVQRIDGPLLILAGAGSGKTKTLTTRLAYLLCEIGIPPQNTLTLTFTNKAAKEMQERALNLIAKSNLQATNTPLLCTFHKFGQYFLQKYLHLLNRPNIFNIIDEDDKRKILRDIKKNTTFDIIQPPSTLSEIISNYKNERIFPENGKEHGADPVLISIYNQYEHYLCANNLVDFDDLLLLPYRILLENEALRIQISNHYEYIMVDEYQDTNDLQVALLKQLCSQHQNLCVVGDDDQSIYSWRGANIRNILDFGKTFQNPKIIKLEQNYRSTKKILDTANKLILHNQERYNKTLQATRVDGDDVCLLKSENDKEEMAKIINSINNLIEKGVRYEDIAILFRLNALSRNVEENLNRAKIPFKMIGVIRFYERQEIKDILAYLRYAYNPNDNFSFARIINTPRRGIGEVSLAEILQISSEYTNAYEAFQNDAFNSLKIKNKLQDFFGIIESLQESMHDNPKEIPNIFSNKIKLYTDTTKKGSENNEERLQNMQEFFTLFLEFVDKSEQIGIPQNEIIQDFLNDIALSSSSDDVGYDSVKCMSIHNSKGLEFNHVFVIGLEDNLFPLLHFDDLNNPESKTNKGAIAEERRLAYVAFTRAKDTLTLSYAKSRLYRNQRRDFEFSQFLTECGLLQTRDPIFKQQKIALQNDMNNAKNTNALLLKQYDEEENEFQVGDCIQHKIFGFGRIKALQGSGTNLRATINFGGQQRVIATSFLTKIQ